MISPPYLKYGDKVGIVAPAGRVDYALIEQASSILENWGLNVVMGKYLSRAYFQFAGTDKQRAEDVQTFLDDESIRAVFCARGGYGSLRTIGLLDFSTFVKNPKWIIGYSDITVFHAYVNSSLNIETIHGIMPKNFMEPGTQTSLESMKDALFGKKIVYHFKTNKYSRPGVCSGELAGGNLSVLHSIAGTPYDYNYKNKILFIEDLDEYLYHIDRMMMNFKLSNKLKKMKGLLIGDFTDMKDNAIPFGKNFSQIINEAVRNEKYPVGFGLHAGHIQPNLALILGRQVAIDINYNQCTIEFL
jgi:muramoyltetrapeptide carboxypeptidase